MHRLGRTPPRGNIFQRNAAVLGTTAVQMCSQCGDSSRNRRAPWRARVATRIRQLKAAVLVVPVMRSVRFLLSFAPEELVARGELALTRSNVFNATPAPGGPRVPHAAAATHARTVEQLGDVVVATVAFEASGRSTAAHGHVAHAEDGTPVIRFESRDATRLLAFLESGPAPVSVRPFAAATPVPRDVHLPSAFPPALSQLQDRVPCTLVFGAHAALDELTYTLRDANMDVLRSNSLEHLYATHNNSRLDAVVVLLDDRVGDLIAVVQALRALTRVVLGVVDSDIKARMVELFQAGLSDVIQLDAGDATESDNALPKQPARSSAIAAKLLALLQRTRGHGARGAA
jgi:hypothetical protein